MKGKFTVINFDWFTCVISWLAYQLSTLSKTVGLGGTCNNLLGFTADKIIVFDDLKT